MRRSSRSKNKNGKVLADRMITYSIVGIVSLITVLAGLLLYSKSLNDNVKDSTMSLEQMADLTENNTEDTQSASTEIGKTVEESKNEVNSTNETNTNTNSTNVASVNSESKNTTTKTESNTTKATTNTKNGTSTETNTQQQAETKKELGFQMPVEGEISKEYAKDSLVYSETLQEWVTHLGIDIKAEKTTVVKAAEEGTIKSIKNDPRYGLTIVIEHQDGFQTVYSNLLTSEFVVEGEKVEKGQSIGTVGNTAVFEIADEPHLHFEILKDSIQVDPNIYIK